MIWHLLIQTNGQSYLHLPGGPVFVGARKLYFKSSDHKLQPLCFTSCPTQRLQLATPTIVTKAQSPSASFPAAAASCSGCVKVSYRPMVL